MSATRDSILADPERLIADLQRQLAECRAERDEALRRETATAEVLDVINSSHGDLAPVFDAILEKALRLCEAVCGQLATYDREAFEFVALKGDARWLQQRPRGRLPASRGLTWSRIVAGEPYVHILDALDTEAYRSGHEGARDAVIAGGRTFLTVALRREQTLLGALTVYRQEVRPFSDRQIALLQNFAAQAVIAMENARLLTETREALEQQTATSEVLQVINSSPGDLTPVFDAMLEKAMRLCEAPAGYLLRYENGKHSLAAGRGLSQKLARFMADMPQPAPKEAQIQILEGASYVHVHDLRDSEAYRSGTPLRRAAVDLGGLHTGLAVPLFKDGQVLGNFCIARYEVRPFSDKQIALLENFAAQAVIAIENTRLITETREALEQQTATAEVLQVINSSPGDLAPVFDAILEKAHTLCGAAHGGLNIYDGERFRNVAAHAIPPRFAELMRQPFHARPIQQRLLRGERYVHVPDMMTSPREDSNDSIGRASDEAGIRTLLLVPLRKDGVLLGYITAHREEVRPFSDKQIALLESFAAQAVIAIENTRLITETREALEQQTATAEVLQVINSSPGDLTPVFDAILEKAHSLCAVAQGSLELYDGEWFRAAAVRGLSDEFAEILRQGCPAADNPATRPLIEGSRFAHIQDLADTDYTVTRSAAELGAARTLLCVPLRRDEALLGMIACARKEVRPFSEKEIALLESFAAQAVIAMDNARLLNEIRQRQAELRVTFDNMGDGVAMFDSELRLAAWNLNFQRILELPDPLLAERPRVADFVRYLATHGEYGAVDVEAEVRRLTELAGTQWSAERARPDGRVIEVRSNPVPGGGVVLIYSDITERKRAEAEIHAARDTAEKALQELQTAQASLLHAQKMAALGQLTAGIAHEIKNPLNFVNNFAELSGELLLELRETTAPVVAALGEDERAAVDEVVEMLRGNLGKIAEHGKRADGIVKSMLEHSRGVSGERRVVDLNAMIEEALNLAYHGARAQDQNFNITLECELAHSLAPIELVPQDMTRVFLNLFGNGFYAAAKRGREAGEANFRPVLNVTTRDLGEAVEIRVRDNGTGIAPEIRDKLFQPFFTTKPTGEGTGLGLSMSYDIITQQHGGTIEVDSRLGEFTEFTIRLPRSHRTAAEAAS